MSYLDWIQYTTEPTKSLVPMNKRSKRNSNTWLILEFLRNAVPLSGSLLASLLPIFFWILRTSLTCSMSSPMSSNFTEQDIAWSQLSGQVRQISYLCSLDKFAKQKQYLLLIIDAFVQLISGYKYFKELDILMEYYIFDINNKSQELCVIITPFGKFKLKCLPMGLKYAPAFALKIME